jgi:hypothetical protein
MSEECEESLGGSSEGFPVLLGKKKARPFSDSIGWDVEYCEFWSLPWFLVSPSHFFLAV